MLDEFLEKYFQNFEITGCKHLMESFIWLEVEQSKSMISLHLDKYIRETIGEYQWYFTRTLKQKLIPLQPGNVLDQRDLPVTQEPKKQKLCHSNLTTVSKLQFTATWVRFEIVFAVGQLARFFALAGPTHWAALQ